MVQVVDFLTRHGYVVLFLAVFAEQIGLPLPALPILIGAGALASGGHMDYTWVVVLAVAATLSSDAIWYEIGRRRGGSVLGLLCRISLEPDSCVRKTESTFARHGAVSLMIAKFVPGLNTVAPPMAGILRMGYPRFLTYDAIGAVLWIVVFTGIGYLCSSQLEQVVARASTVGGSITAVLVGGAAVYIVWKYVQRRRLLGRLTVERIDSSELARALEADDPPTVVDLRGVLERQGDPVTIPGALMIPAEDLEQKFDELPRRPEAILFCS